MTERFIVDDAGTLIDMQTRDMFDIVEEVCPLLNEQHEQIQELKNEVFDWKASAEDYLKLGKSLKKENEELKKDVEYWKQVASQYSNELNVFEHCKKYKTECKDIYWSSD